MRVNPSSENTARRYVEKNQETERWVLLLIAPLKNDFLLKTTVVEIGTKSGKHGRSVRYLAYFSWILQRRSDDPCEPYLSFASYPMWHNIRNMKDYIHGIENRSCIFKAYKRSQILKMGLSVWSTNWLEQHLQSISSIYSTWGCIWRQFWIASDLYATFVSEVPVSDQLARDSFLGRPYCLYLFMWM